jgi:hypothetical protein
MPADAIHANGPDGGSGLPGLSPADAKRLSGPGMWTFIKVDLWELNSDGRRRALGGPTEDRYREWAEAAARRDDLPLPHDVLARLGAILASHEAIGSLFETAGDQTGWLNGPHQAAPFSGRPPTELASSGSLAERLAAMAFVRAAGQGIYMRPN